MAWLTETLLTTEAALAMGHPKRFVMELSIVPE